MAVGHATVLEVSIMIEIFKRFLGFWNETNHLTFNVLQGMLSRKRYMFSYPLPITGCTEKW